MSNYSKLSNSELVLKTKNLVSEERKLTLEILHLLRKVEKRRLHLELGFGSLHEFTVKELGFDDASAARRIAAMRLIRDIPEVQGKLESGELTLTVAAQAQRFFKGEEKVLNPYRLDEKKAVIKSLENKSIKEAQNEFIKLSPQAIPREKERPISENQTEIRLVMPNELKLKLDRLRSNLSHKLKTQTIVELLDAISDLALEVVEPKEKAKGTTALRCGSAKAPSERSRYIPNKIKLEVWKKANSQCQFISPETQRKCMSTHRLQIEHKIPYSMGGTHDIENLTLFCSAHNAHMAVKLLGEKKINPYLQKSLPS